MQRIFISFRKLDERVTRELLYTRLSTEYGAQQVFKSGESIPPGTDYVRILEAQARACPVMLVLIGERWLGAHGPDGLRSIDREHDWVRVEIRTALESGNRVIPVLFGDDILLPSPSQLPPDIAAMGTLQALRISHSAVDTGLGQLVAVLNSILPRLSEPGGSAEPVPPPVPLNGHNEVHARDVGVGMVTGTVHGPVIGGNAHGPVAGRDLHQTNVKQGGGGAAVGLSAALMAVRKPFAKAADWAGDHRMIASISAVVVLGGAGTGIALATTPSSGAAPGLAVIAATGSAASDPSFTANTALVSPTPVPTLTTGASLSSISTSSRSDNAWSNGSVLAVQAYVTQASPGADAIASGNQYQLLTYSLSTGQQLDAFTPDGFDQGTSCADDLAPVAQGTDLLLLERTNVIPAQGLTPSTESVELMGVDATNASQVWQATLPVVPGTSNESNFCSRTDPPSFLSYTSDGKFALDTETGTTYLVNLSTGAVTAEPGTTEVLGRWLVVPSATDGNDSYPASAAIVDPSTGATVTTIADGGTGVTGDLQAGDAGQSAAGAGLGTDVNGTADIVVGSRLTNNDFGDTVGYSLPSFQRTWIAPNGSPTSASYGGLAFDPTNPGIVIGSQGTATDDYGVSGIDVKTGKTLWSVSTQLFYCGATNGHIYIVANDQLVELDEMTGKQISYDASVSSCPLVYNGVVDEVTPVDFGTAYTNNFIIG